MSSDSFWILQCIQSKALRRRLWYRNCFQGRALTPVHFGYQTNGIGEGDFQSW